MGTKEIGVGATAQRHLQKNKNKTTTKNKNKTTTKNKNKTTTKNKNKKATKNKGKNNNIGQYPKAAKSMGDS